MATAQRDLPVAARSIDARAARWRGTASAVCRAITRDRCDTDALLNGRPTAASLGGYGHMELVYDFAEGGEADGWLHALFRYEDRATGHAAETSFGAHVFNTVLTYGSEPQSYSGRAPGLTTRLFLRLGAGAASRRCAISSIRPRRRGAAQSETAPDAA